MRRRDVELIAARGLVEELVEAVNVLQTVGTVELVSVVADNTPFQAISLAYDDEPGDPGGDLPFQVAQSYALKMGCVRICSASDPDPENGATMGGDAYAWDWTGA